MRVLTPLVAAAGVVSIGLGTLAVMPGSASAAPAPAVHTVAPADGVWPAQAAGRPADLKAGSATGYYLWHGPDGWHLEVTHPGATRVVFAGSVATNGFISYQRVDDEAGDVTRLGPHQHVLGFAFSNHGRLDGVAFTAHRATELTVDLTIDGKTAGVANVNIGANGLHPDRVPFTISRTSIR